MKIAINKGYGGFTLSEEFWKRYAEINNIHLISTDGVIRKSFYKDNVSDDNMLDDRIFTRDDKTLISIIEEIGCEAASGKFSDLKIVDIPEGVEWEIQEYDGKEWIAEKHRVWS